MGKRATRPDEPLPPERLLWTIEEVAKALGVSPDTVQSLANIGQVLYLPKVNIGRRTLFRPEDVRAFAQLLSKGQ